MEHKFDLPVFILDCSTSMISEDELRTFHLFSSNHYKYDNEMHTIYMKVIKGYYKCITKGPYKTKNDRLLLNRLFEFLTDKVILQTLLLDDSDVEIEKKFPKPIV